MNKITKYLAPVVVTLATLLMSLILFHSFYGVYSTAIQELRPLVDFAPSIFTGLITFLLVDFYLYNAFLRKAKDLTSKIYLTALGVIDLALVILFFVRSDFHFDGFYARSLYFLLINTFNIIVLALWLFALYAKKDIFLTKWIDKSPKYYSSLPTHTFVRYSIIAVFAFGALGDILSAIFRFGYYRIEPVWYPVLLFAMMLPTISLVLEIRQHYKKDATRNYINIGVNVLFFALMCNIIFNTNALAYTAQNIFYLDFAASMFVFPYILLLFNLYFIGHGVFVFLKDRFKKEEKAVAAE